MSQDAESHEKVADPPEQILLVDDNRTNLQVLRETLDGQGYRFLIAKNVETALTIANKARPSLILLYIIIFTMNSGHFHRPCRIIRGANHEMPEMPI